MSSFHSKIYSLLLVAMKALSLSKIQIVSLYNLLAMNVKITASYFLPFGAIVLIGNWLGVHHNNHWNFYNIYEIDTLIITIGYIIYISLFCFVIDIVVSILPIWRTMKNILYVFVNLILLTWIMIDFTEANQWELLDKKGSFNQSDFRMIFFFSFILISIFWVIKKQMVVYSEEYVKSTYARAISILVLAALYFLLLTFTIATFRGFDYLYETGALFGSSILLKDNLIYWMGIIIGLSSVFLLYRLISFRFRLSSYIILFAIATFFFWIKKNNSSWNDRIHTYREILIYYNPLWLDEDSRGHTKFDI